MKATGRWAPRPSRRSIGRACCIARSRSSWSTTRGRILLQRRNPRKYHSGGLWANSCCGHPRPGERTVTAARRRLNEELGVTDPLRFGFFARYQAALDHGMQENELVYVYFGRLKSQPQPNPAEVVDLEFLSLREIRPAHQAEAGLLHVLDEALYPASPRRDRTADSGRDRPAGGIMNRHILVRRSCARAWPAPPAATS